MADSDERQNGKRERQILYLTYRGMPADAQGRRMTQARAAKLAGVDSSTVTRWKREDPQFAARERQIRQEGISRAREMAKSGAYALLASAIYTVGELLRGKDVPDGVRARLAMQVMEWAGAAEPVQVELLSDPWGALLQQLQSAGEGVEEDEVPPSPSGVFPFEGDRGGG